MEVKIDPDLCIACGLCVDICPEVFKLETNSAVVIQTPVPEELIDAVKEAVESCPVDAISIDDL